MTALLEVRGLTVGYGAAAARPTVVVRDVDLTLRAGTILGLAGESGCGKSTAALAAMGYRAPGAAVLGGSSRLGDDDLLSLGGPALARLWGRRISYVAQDAAQSLNPLKRIGWLLDETLAVHRCRFAAPVCTASHPRLQPLGGGREARCHRLGELTEVRRTDAAEPLEVHAGGAPQLVVDGLRCAYPGRGGVLAVDDVSLAVAPGETLGVVGESGSGKSTLLAAIAGLHVPAGGTISFEGTALPARAASRSRELRGVEELFAAPGHEYTRTLLAAVPRPQPAI